MSKMKTLGNAEDFTTTPLNKKYYGEMTYHEYNERNNQEWSK